MSEPSRALIAIDVAKSVFEVGISRQPGKIDQRLRLSRVQFQRFVANTPPAELLFEACGSSHYWARYSRRHGHSPRLLPPHHTRRYRTRNKTDAADAKALLEASRNEEILAVPTKTVDQQALASLHRLRSGWTRQRTARINSVRGILREFGCNIPLGAEQMPAKVVGFMSDPDTELPSSLHPALSSALDEIASLEQRVADVERQISAVAKQTPLVELLMTVPGVGLLTATALVAMIGDAQRFPSGRHFASYLGLTPKESSSGNRRHLGRISKQGNTYLRTMLIQGARSALLAAKRTGEPHDLQTWALEREAKIGHNKAATALANKMAGIVWAVWTTGEPFKKTRRRNQND